MNKIAIDFIADDIVNHMLDDSSAMELLSMLHSKYDNDDDARAHLCRMIQLSTDKIISDADDTSKYTVSMYAEKIANSVWTRLKIESDCELRKESLEYDEDGRYDDGDHEAELETDELELEKLIEVSASKSIRQTPSMTIDFTDAIQFDGSVSASMFCVISDTAAKVAKTNVQLTPGDFEAVRRACALIEHIYTGKLTITGP